MSLAESVSSGLTAATAVASRSVRVPELTEAFRWPPRPLINRLFLDGLEFGSVGEVTAVHVRA